MMLLSSFGSSSLFVLFLILGFASTITVDAFRYQDDTATDCDDHLVECTTTPTRWFQCPTTCHKQFFEEGSMFEIHDDPEQFFDMSVAKKNGGKTLSLEDYEGYVTIYAIIPLIPGMSQFYYEVLEHVQTIYPYTIQTLIEPFQITTGGNSDDINIHIKEHEKPKTILLEETPRLTEVSNYLQNAPPVAGNPDVRFHSDRVTIFLVSADGIFVEKLNSPSMPLLERRIAVFLKQLEWTPPDL